MCGTWWSDASPLTRFHFGAAVVQFCTGFSLFLLVDEDATVPVYTLYWRRKEGVVVNLESHAIVGFYSGAFLLLSFLNHAITAWCSDWYERVLTDECNPLRWLEYSVSASLMHVMIAQLCGVADAYLLACIAALTALTMVFGWLQESLRPLLQKDDRFTFMPFVLGCLPWLAQWAVILAHFYSAGSPPEWVYALMLAELGLDALFAGWMLFTYWMGYDYEFTEKGYVVLSLTAKQVLAWVNFGGTRSL